MPRRSYIRKSRYQIYHKGEYLCTVNAELKVVDGPPGMGEKYLNGIQHVIDQGDPKHLLEVYPEGKSKEKDKMFLIDIGHRDREHEQL